MQMPRHPVGCESHGGCCIPASTVPYHRASAHTITTLSGPEPIWTLRPHGVKLPFTKSIKRQCNIMTQQLPHDKMAHLSGIPNLWQHVGLKLYIGLYENLKKRPEWKKKCCHKQFVRFLFQVLRVKNPNCMAHQGQSQGKYMKKQLWQSLLE